MRVLLVRLGAFGDLIHTLPLAADLHTCGHQLHWLCEERWAQVLQGSPVISRIHTCSRRPDRAEYRRLARQLHDAAFDAVIDAQGLAKSARWAWLSGAPKRLGFRPPRSREGAWLLANRRLPALGVHVVDQQRSLARGLGLRPAGPPRFALPAWKAEAESARAWLQAQKLQRPLALNVGAGWPSKVWPADQQRRWLELAAAAGQRPLVIWGSPAEEQLARELCRAVAQAVLAPPTSLPELAGLLDHCGLLVSGDTGPLHLAAARGCPTIGLFGPVPMERNGPRGQAHPNLQAKSPAWERKRADLVDWSDLNAERVWQLAQTLQR